MREVRNSPRIQTTLARLGMILLDPRVEGREISHVGSTGDLRGDGLEPLPGRPSVRRGVLDPDESFNRRPRPVGNRRRKSGP